MTNYDLTPEAAEDLYKIKERCGRLLIVRILHEKMDYQRHL